MSALTVYLQLYADCFKRALRAIGRNPWTLLLPAVILLARAWAGRLLLPLGLVGGFVVALASAALASSYLYFLGDLVQGGRAPLSSLRRSLTTYLWPVVNVFFVLWVASLALQLLLGGRGQAAAIMLALWGIALIALNAVPEVIYLRGTHGGLQTVGASWRFLEAQWLPWFAVNLPLLAALVLLGLFLAVPYVGGLVLGAALHVVMVFRGQLFRELDGTSHRQRIFALKMR